VHVTELVSQITKLGGNGPIMANALASFGLRVTYLGLLGHPNIHPVFAEFARRAEVYSIAEPGYTDAIEFEDGKLMCGKHDCLKQVNWANLLKHIPEEQLIEIFEQSSLIALGNRFRLILNEVDVVKPDHPMPKLPVAQAVWKPRPDFETALACWINAGGAHHTAFTQAATTEMFEDFAEIAGLECVTIAKGTTESEFKKELRWNEVYYYLAHGPQGQ